MSRSSFIATGLFPTNSYSIMLDFQTRSLMFNKFDPPTKSLKMPSATSRKNSVLMGKFIRPRSEVTENPFGYFKQE